MKKTIVIPCFILLLTVGLVIVNSIAVGRIATSFAERSDSETLDTLFRDFRKAERFIGLTVSHDDLSRIEDTFAEGVGAAEADDRETEEAMRVKLYYEFLHLKTLTGVNIDSIL